MLAVGVVGDEVTRMRSWAELQRQTDFERCEGTRGGSPEAALSQDEQEFGGGRAPLEDVGVLILRGGG